jgi:hypothetical protein
MTLFDIAYDDFKREDTTNVITITLYTDDRQPITPDASHTWKAKVSKEDKYVGEYPVTISGDTIKLSSSNLTRLPNGDYGLELWETYSGSTTIYPSAGVMEFRVHRNANDTLGTIDPTTDINAIIDDLHKAGQNIKVVATNTLPAGSKASVTQSIANGENQLTFNIPQGIQGEQGNVGPAPTLKVGTVTKLNPDQAPTANLSGGNGSYTLNLGIPQGVQGETNATAINALNATNAIREQITAVLNALGDVSVPSVAMQSNSYITPSGELATYGSSLSASDYVPVKVGQLVILQNVSGNDNRSAALYDANKHLLKSYKYDSQPVRQIPVSQDGYIRYTNNNGETTITIFTPRFAIKDNVVANPYADMSLFQKVGVIGDSYASGELVTYNDTVPTFTDHYEISWGQILARKHGFKCINYSAGGKTTASWLADANHGLQKLLSDDPCELYILALGINDRDHFELGTTDDISTDGTGTAQSFYGCYSRIIYNIIAHAPKAKLILSTLAATDDKSEKFNQAIIDLATAFKIAYIKQSDDAYFTSAAYKNMQGGHPRAVGYSGMAAALDRLIVKRMVNDSYFNDLFM